MPRNTRGMIAVYSVSGSGAVLRHISRREAQAGVDAGDLTGIYTGRGKTRELVATRVLELQRVRDSDPATITPTETIANAIGTAAQQSGSNWSAPRFVAERNKGEIVRDTQGKPVMVPTYFDDAMSKIEAWPEEYDRNSVVITAGRASMLTTLSAEVVERVISF